MSESETNDVDGTVMNCLGNCRRPLPPLDPYAYVFQVDDFDEIPGTAAVFCADVQAGKGNRSEWIAIGAAWVTNLEDQA